MHCTADFCMHHYAWFSQIGSHIIHAYIELYYIMHAYTEFNKVFEVGWLFIRYSNILLQNAIIPRGPSQIGIMYVLLRF